MFGLIALVGGIAAVVALVFFLIDAFQDEWWKGLLCFFCLPYLIYYMFVEFEHEYKWQIILTYWIGGVLSGSLGQGFLHH
ncbi:MAG: hypothetical protein HY318_06585 [Armatimonadetes bacterium]|nr:hypothetical protein [Armatimonadota bacterium]